MPFPTTLIEVDAHLSALKKALTQAGVPTKLLQSVQTRAYLSGRRQTGEFQSNRQSRWTLNPNDPQYGTQLDCRIILIKLLGAMVEFKNGPVLPTDIISMLEHNYFFTKLQRGSYRDALL